VGWTAADIKLIRYFGKPEYFFERDWTDRNSLIRFRKLDFTRKSGRGAQKARSLDEADEPAPRVMLSSLTLIRERSISSHEYRPYRLNGNLQHSGQEVALLKVSA
jgi:hypothetical protein